MPRKAREKSSSGVYHVMLRGVNRQQLFYDEDDNVALLSALERFCTQGRAKIYAYCLMGNHAHIVIREGSDTLDTVMRRTGSSFAHWHNAKYARSGGVFQDRYRSEPIENATHLVQAIRYIHMNPVKAGLCGAPEEYPWSSYGAYANGTRTLVSTREVLRMADLAHLLAEEAQSGEASLIEPPEPRTLLTDARARAIIREVTGCGDASAFCRLDVDIRVKALRTLFEQGLSASQICRLTGTSYAFAKKCQ